LLWLGRIPRTYEVVLQFDRLPFSSLCVHGMRNILTWSAWPRVLWITIWNRYLTRAGQKAYLV